ncbi:hypothetical protein H6S82_12815 [Planktothrix sp. FACHB-1355]|uniref:Uncharacterized protein n=1 Tax=Aerosakkonema funiforme FACHB-1375 TaxID=2949571 RepID=A0A926VM84_9CYAN|nr:MULTISPECIES: hypothetical protein [Oscillatoriales]MBD2186390.1 hypothetical protein [Aerosakkonema funiforme FACHB-1375]MBD3559737.1 hypothetical protein [Planktothrix sp. FACHB-1355]
MTPPLPLPFDFLPMLRLIKESRQKPGSATLHQQVVLNTVIGLTAEDKKLLRLKRRCRHQQAAKEAAEV